MQSYLCCIVLSYCFFFFKQKTAYEMRISDWSSDVCSSDLRRLRLQGHRDAAHRGRGEAPRRSAAAHPGAGYGGREGGRRGAADGGAAARRRLPENPLPGCPARGEGGDAAVAAPPADPRRATLSGAGPCGRTEERHGGKAWVRTCSTPWCAVH